MLGKLALVVIAGSEHAEEVVEGRDGDVAGGDDGNSAVRIFGGYSILIPGIERIQGVGYEHLPDRLERVPTKRRREPAVFEGLPFNGRTKTLVDPLRVGEQAA